MVHDLVAALLSANPTVGKRTRSRKISIGYPGLSMEMATAVERGEIPECKSINEAAALIRAASSNHSRAPVAVVDEFERIQSANDRTLFADLIKQLGDQSIPVKLIFCGVGSSLEDLLDTHHSCYRYLTALPLERLSISGRVEIIDNALTTFGITMDDSTRYRISTISDGFPHFVHLVCEKLFWQVYEDADVVVAVKPEHYINAITVAVQDIEEHLKIGYEKAAKKYTDDYAEVLWAVADDKELSRRSADIYQSYLRIKAERKGTAISREKFNTRMNALKKPSHASILKATRAGWYEFSENIVRGYVRLRAAEQNIDLEVDHQLMSRKFPLPARLNS
jgi:hypothetical protein